MRRSSEYFFLFILILQFSSARAEPQLTIKDIVEEPAYYHEELDQRALQLDKAGLESLYAGMVQRIEELNAEIMGRLPTGEIDRELYFLMEASLNLMSIAHEEAILIYALGDHARAMKFLDRYHEWAKIRSKWPFQQELERNDIFPLLFNLHFLSDFEGFLDHPFISKGFDTVPFEQIYQALTKETEKLETREICSKHYMLPPLEFGDLEEFLSEKTWGEVSSEEKEQLEQIYQQLNEFTGRGCPNWSFEVLEYLVLANRGDPNSILDPTRLYATRSILSKFSLSVGGITHLAIQKKACEGAKKSADIKLNTLCFNLAKAHMAILKD